MCFSQNSSYNRGRTYRWVCESEGQAETPREEECRKVLAKAAGGQEVWPNKQSG